MVSARPQKNSASSREALIEAGLACFQRSGYARARLADIAEEAGLTTGAFYGHFPSKTAFFDDVFAKYGNDLQEALNGSESLSGQLVAYLEVSRRYKGVIRAGNELIQSHREHTIARQNLRESCAGMLVWHLREPLTLSQARVAARFVVDILDQQAWMEANELATERPAEAIAANLAILIEKGLYKA